MIFIEQIKICYTNKLIEISEFVDEKEIDSIYYETPYYLQPEKSGVKSYTLLRDALKKRVRLVSVFMCLEIGRALF